MDEILSSIKRIIANDERVKPGGSKKSARATSPKQDETSEEILELTEMVEDEDQGDEILLDDSKAQSLRHSFSALQTLSEPGATPQIVRSGETSLEGLVRDMMRPMLKEWLDSNLPDLVESMVDREITRITRKS